MEGQDAALWVQVDYVNRTEGYRYGGDDPFKSNCYTLGEVYASFLGEYGRCIGKVYIDEGAIARPIGWAFLKRQKYDDCEDTFLVETWVTVHIGPPTDTREYHYA